MTDIEKYDFNGRRALVRVDYNVPLNDKMQVTDDTRIRATLPTLKMILDGGGSAVLMAHLGRPKDGPEDKFSLRHIVPAIENLTGREVLFGGDCIGSKAFEMSANLQPGQLLLLENLRFYAEEKKGDRDFAEKLSRHGDVYVNDAFGAAHRAHASTSVVAQFFTPDNKMFGCLMAREVANASRVLHNADHPFTAILGGAKVSDKVLIVEKLLDLADNILIGGGMAFTFARAMGGRVGDSLLEEDRIEIAAGLIEKAKQKGVQLLIPPDSVIATAFSNDAERKNVPTMQIPDGWMGLDIGPETAALYKKVLMSSKTILWNGPMGVFEMENFRKGTVGLASSVAEATSGGAFSLVGGGDSVAAVNKFGYADKVSYVSTGGGALLEFFEGKQLPGIVSITTGS